MSGSTISNTITVGIVLGTVSSVGGTYASPLTIAATGAVETSSGDAIYGPGTQAWTVINQGTVMVAGTAGIGIDLTLGGSVDNAGRIEGPTGVHIESAGIVTNFGTISGTTAGAVYLGAGGAVVNGATNATSAVISGWTAGIVIGQGVGTVINYGTIVAEGGYGPQHDAVYLVSGAVINWGVVGLGGPHGYGIDFGQGFGTVTNYGTIASVRVQEGSVINSGMISSVVAYGTIINSGVINGVFLFNGLLANSGTISGGGRYPTDSVVELLGSGTIMNSGTIVATDSSGFGFAVYIVTYNSGTLINTGVISVPGTYAVVGGPVINYGTIEGGGAGVVAGYKLVNYGVIRGGANGVSLGARAGSGGVTSFGTVIGAIGIGVVATSTAGQILTVAGRVIAPTGISASTIAAGYTVTVAGRVIGTAGTAVSLAGGSDRLIVAPGAAFQGFVDGGGGASVLEIAATAGAAAGLAGRVAAAGAAAYVSLGSVVNFSALEVDPGATFGGSGVLSFASLVNAGQIDIGAGNSLALGVVASAAATGAIDLETGGTVAFHGAVAAQRLTFQPPGGTALIDRPEAFSATISGFTGTLDLLDLTALNPAGATATLSASDQLVVADGTQSVALQLDTGTDYTGVTWQTSADGTGGTDVAPVCFCRGTRILTDRGEVAVEALRVGDRVATLAGSFKPIRWIGFGRDLVTRRNSLARPIVVRRGALADGVPRRDLYLTHGHALYLDGVLIPVEHLVNHRSILWDEAARIVEYYHIELAGHDVVLAEGAPAESYHDAGNRARFHNTRPGSAPAAVGGTCAPVATGGEIVELVWARLFERAGGQVALATTDDPDLHLVVAGERLDPASVAGGLYTFALAAPPAGPLFLRSRSAVPSLTGRDRRDHRRLGVAIRQIVLHGAGVMTCLDHDAPSFRTGGCHLPEAGHSWTDGELALPATLFAHLACGFALIVNTRSHAMRYPNAATAAAAGKRAFA